MTWTYGNDPTANADGSYNIDLVRLLIGDTDTNHQLLTDEELDFFISQQNNYYIAAAMAAETLVAKFAPSTQEKLGDWEGAYQQRYDHFVGLGKELRRKAARNLKIWVGGIQPAEDEADEHKRRFTRDQMLDKTW
jgi:hypothetical protein